MNLQPEISVIVCTYNQEKFISQTIESILSQETQIKFEILIGDDCSQDSTREVISYYSHKFPDIVIPIYPEKNLGATRNFLNLVNHARGRMISICDGDDYWISHDVLQQQWDILHKIDNYGMVCAKAKCYNESTKEFTGTLGYSGAEDIYSMLKGDQDVAAPTIAFNTKILKSCINDCEWYINNNVFFDTIQAYWFSLFSKIKFIDEYWAVYRVLPNSGCHSSDPQKRNEYSRRYFSIKWRFILEHHLELEFSHNLLMESYDSIIKFATYEGKDSIRKTKRYKIGALICMPLSIIPFKKNQKR